MNHTHVLIDAKYEEHIRIKHLSIDPSLQGAKAQFEFEKHLIEISLPRLPSDDKIKPGDPYAEAEADTWDLKGEIIDIYICFLSVAVLALQFELPLAAAMNPRINASLYTKDEIQVLDERSDQLYFRARRAMDYFIRVVRWKVGFALVALDTRPDNATLRGGRLFNLTGGGAFYSPRVGRFAVMPPRHRLTTQEWNEIGKILSAGTLPPIWTEYLMSAQQRIESGDMAAAILDLAIAAETIIRRSIDALLPSDTPEWTRDAIGRINISTFTDKWTEYGLPEISKAQWFPTIRLLLRRRNALMHRGDNDGIGVKFCRDAVSAVENLINALVS